MFGHKNLFQQKLWNDSELTSTSFIYRKSYMQFFVVVVVVLGGDFFSFYFFNFKIFNSYMSSQT